MMHKLNLSAFSRAVDLRGMLRSSEYMRIYRLSVSRKYSSPPPEKRNRGDWNNAR